MAKLSIRSFFIVCLLLGASLEQPKAKEVEMDEGVRRFIRTYCIDCHGQDKAKGDRDFHELVSPKEGRWVVDLQKNVELLRDILDQLGFAHSSYAR